MKTQLLALMLIFFVFPAIAINPPEKGVYYSSSVGKFSIVFPTQYKIETTDNGDSETVKISSSSNDQTYFASYTVHTVELTGLEDLAEVSLNSFSEQLGGTISEKKEWKVNKNNGLEATMNLKEQDAKVQYYVILVGQVQYQLIVLAANSSFDQKAADAFIKSFKLDK
ncbi:MAG TPA: hypothetical protein VIN10_14940 [Bacteroidales bacterium]